MRTWKSLVPYLAGATLALTAVATLRSPKVSAAARAILVETVLPSSPFYDSMQVLNAKKSIGPGAGTLGVTNITLTNFDSTPPSRSSSSHPSSPRAAAAAQEQTSSAAANPR